MSVDLTKLNSLFAGKIEDVFDDMKKSGYRIDIRSGFRSLDDQAKIWRKGRPLSEIQARIKELRALDCDYLASIIENVGPQPGKNILTNALPGQSYHNWGEAVDVFVNDDASGSGKYYRPLAECVKKHGLTSGWYFSQPDPGHIQYSVKELGKSRLKEINDHFYIIYENK